MTDNQTASTIATRGFIVADDTSIAGIGLTESAALADAAEWTREGVEVHVSRREWQTNGQRGAYLAPASAALLAQVDRDGGCIAWEFIDGVACTVEEADDSAA